MNRLNQRRKKWHKKPKVDVNNPNKCDEHTGYQNDSWMFSTKNRDRPSGHTPNTYDKGYEEDSAKSKFYKRKNDLFFIQEGLADWADEYTEQERQWELYELEQERDMLIFYQQEEEREWREDYEELRRFEAMTELEDHKYEISPEEQRQLEDAMDMYY